MYLSPIVPQFFLGFDIVIIRIHVIFYTINKKASEYSEAFKVPGTGVLSNFFSQDMRLIIGHSKLVGVAI